MVLPGRARLGPCSVRGVWWDPCLAGTGLVSLLAVAGTPGPSLACAP